jgi:hypothetical protein
MPRFKETDICDRKLSLMYPSLALSDDQRPCSSVLRYSELSNIKMKNIIFHDSHVELTLDQSKTGIYRRGNTVVIAKTGNVIVNYL